MTDIGKFSVKPYDKFQKASMKGKKDKMSDFSGVRVKNAFYPFVNTNLAIQKKDRRGRKKLSQESLHMTPYEKYLRQTLDDEKRKLEKLNIEYSKANPIKKMRLKAELEQVSQNILLLSADLHHFENTGLEWLREPTKERDEKSEGLKPVQIEAITGQATSGQKATPSASTSAVAQPKGAPIVGRPVGAPAMSRPMVGQPVGTQVSRPVTNSTQTQQNQPTTSTPQPSAPAQVSKPAQSAPRVGTPVVGKPIGAPMVGKPVSSTPQPTPRVGTPIDQPVKKEDKKTGTEQQQSQQTDQNSEASSITTGSS